MLTGGQLTLRKFIGEVVYPKATTVNDTKKSKISIEKIFFYKNSPLTMIHMREKQGQKLKKFSLK